MAHFRLANGLFKGTKLVLRTLGHQFPPSIVQVPHGPNQIKPARQGLDGIPKAHTLHCSLVINPQTASAHGLQAVNPTTGTDSRTCGKQVKTLKRFVYLSLTEQVEA